MGHKKKPHNSAPIPPNNQPKAGPPQPDETAAQGQTGGGAPFQEEDPKRRIGDYAREGEHSFVQPGGKNDANR